MGFRNFWNEIKKIRAERKKIGENVPSQTAYTMIILGLIHFMVLGSALIDLRTLELFNWGIYNELVGKSLQIPIIAGVMVFDAIVMIWGVYLLKHVEHTDDKSN